MLDHLKLLSKYIYYCYNLFSLISLELEDLVKGTEVYKRTPNLVCMQYLLLVPESCKVENTLDTEHGDIVITKEEVLQFTENVMGKDRVYKPTLYKLKKGEEVRLQAKLFQ